MSCTTYLVAVPKAEPVDEAISGVERTRKPTGKHVVVAQGNQGIPPLWLALFEEDDLVEWTMPRKGEDDESYVSLTTTRAKALRVLERRSKTWPFAADPAFVSVLAALRKVLEKASASHLALEPYELFASAYDTKSWRKELLKWLKGLESGKGAAFDEALRQHFVTRSKTTLGHDSETLGFALAGGGTKTSGAWARIDVKVASPGAGKLSKPARTWLKWIDKVFGEVASIAKREPLKNDAVINLGLLGAGRNAWVQFFDTRAAFSPKKLATGKRINLKDEPFAYYRERTREVIPRDLTEAMVLDVDALAVLAGAVRQLPSFRAIAEGKVRRLSFAPDAALVIGNWSETVSPHQPRDFYRITWGGGNSWGLCRTVVSVPLFA